MEIQIEGPKEPVAIQYRAQIERGWGAPCTCCERPTAKQDFAYVTAYKPRSAMMRGLVPKENIAAYGVCKECAKLSEAEVFTKCEQTLVRHGLCQGGQKPLGSHLPGHKHKHRVPGNGA